MTARMCATERGAKPVELTPVRRRLHNGYQADTGPAATKITGCDVCGKTRREMTRATPIVGPLGRLVVCSRCLGALTNRPSGLARSWVAWKILASRVRAFREHVARKAQRPVALPEVRCSVSLHRGPGAPSGARWDQW